MGFPYEFNSNEESDTLHAARRVRRRPHVTSTTAPAGIPIAVALRQARLARRYKYESKPVGQEAQPVEVRLASSHR